MPKRSRSRLGAQKRVKKPKAMVARLTRAPSSIFNAVPPKMDVKLVYADGVRLNSGVTDFAAHVFRGNSIFDPDFTGVGHQPLGHDQWAALYKKYRVNAVKFEVWYASNTDAIINSMFMCPSNSSTVINWDQMLESPYCQTGMTTGRTGTGPGYLRFYVTSGQMKGDMKTIYDKDMEAEFGTNPAVAWFLHMQATSPGQTAVDVRTNVRITYYTTLFAPLQLTES